MTPGLLYRPFRHYAAQSSDATIIAMRDFTRRFI
jgi:hypothetical protein